MSAATRRAGALAPCGRERQPGNADGQNRRQHEHQQTPVETHLAALGFEIGVAASESHLCCGSAGTYSVLQPELAYQLRDRKLENLAPLQPQAIVSANIGCIQHQQSGTTTPVRHWVVVLDEALVG